MKPLLLVPLDDRPVNLDFPLLLAEIGGERLLAPPAEMLGRFLTAGDGDALAGWLLQNAPDARGAIVSLDMLAYGGLVASRTSETSLTEALRRLELLRDVKRRFPQLTLYAFNVIMRLTITGADAETRAAGRAIFQYSILRDRVERLGELSAVGELARVEAEIPPPLLHRYLQARARNHAMNRAAISLLGDGVLDFLALVQEDTAPCGLHVLEQQALQQLGHACAPEDGWQLYPGTDEAAMTLLARYLLREQSLSFSLTTRFRDGVAAETPALFEDVPLRRTVASHLKAVGAAEDVCVANVFAVHTFVPPQGDLFEMPPLAQPTWASALAGYPTGDFSAWLTTFGTAPVALADVAYCNGGDPHLLDALLADGRYWSLESYAGWNTAGNTVGTALAHAAMRRCAFARGVTGRMSSAHERALLIRLLDDGLYQSIVRGWAMARAEESGYTPLNLGEKVRAVEEWVDSAMQALWHEIRIVAPVGSLPRYTFTAELPWGRLFEVRIRLTET